MVKKMINDESRDIEDLKSIEDMFNDENLDWHQELKYPQFYKDFEDTSQKLLKIINTKFDPYIKETILKMSFVHAFTAMETFFFNALIVLLRQHPECIDKILNILPHFRNSRKNTNVKNHHLTKMIIKEIAYESYQNPKKISAVYAILGIKTENYDKLSEYLEMRNDIDHRNGRNKSGKKIKFSRRRLIDCMKEIKFFVDHVERKIQELNKK